MRPSSRLTDADDAGSAALEFIVGGLVLLVPIVYLVVALGLVQEQALGVEAGARHIARAVATAPDAAAASGRAERILASIADEYGLDPASVDVDLECVPAGDGCPAAGALLTVTVSTRVRLPLAPPVLGLDDAARVPVEAVAVQKVSRVWSER